MLMAAVVTAEMPAATQSLSVSVRGQVAPDYRRQKLPDGSFKPERYVIADGGKFDETFRDASFDKVSYPQVAGIVARHLATQKYFLAPTTKEADLLIAIYWGATVPLNGAQYNLAVDTLSRAVSESMASGPGAPAPGGGTQPNNPDMSGSLEFAMAGMELENRYRDTMATTNARILGYIEAINDRWDMMPWADIGDLKRVYQDDIEQERYYVVVMAYDLRKLLAGDRKAVRWVTRISIDAQGTSFDERFAQMVASAAPTFGQALPLRRRFYADPSVTLGELKFLGEAAAPKEPVADRTAK